jgi:glycosyltransferase involved in cell wall biosynthesis
MLASILLPARNAAATIDAALHSVRRQTLPDWECIVVDDGSTDDTASLVAAFAARDSRVRLLRTDGAGLVEALCLGLAHCRGAIVFRMDADDLMRRERLACQAALLDAHPDLVAAGAHVRIIPRAGLTDRRRAYERWLNHLRTPADLRRERFVE